MRHLEDLDRNDVDGALTYYRERYAELGSVPGDEVRVLLMLQDDGEELLARIRALRSAIAK